MVVVSGVIRLEVEGEPAKAMAAGAYAHIPGGARHSALCKPGAPCVYFEEQPGPADFKRAAKDK